MGERVEKPERYCGVKQLAEEVRELTASIEGFAAVFGVGPDFVQRLCEHTRDIIDVLT